MKSHHLFLLLFFFLASCTPSTPAPTMTPVPTPTSTLTPIPTATQTATSTPEAWVAMAEEYGMPEEMAQKLLDNVEAVEFIENESPYVNGITVVANGKDIAFRNDEPISQKEGFELPFAERWVRVDTFEGSKDVDNIPETINYDQLISVEMSNLLYYYASKWQPDVENAKPAEVHKNKIMDIKFLVIWPDTAPNERDLGLLMNVTLPAVGLFTENVFVPMLVFDITTNKIYPIKVVICSGAEVREKVLHKWAKREITALITSFPESRRFPAYVTTTTEELYANTQFTMTERFAAFADGNLAALSEPDIVVATM